MLSEIGRCFKLVIQSLKPLIKMVAIFNNPEDVQNWTYGKAYDYMPSFLPGRVSMIDDNGAEQIIRYGSTNFIWDSI